jgi:RNA polymerase sigma factor (sigma-70 family)
MVGGTAGRTIGQGPARKVDGLSDEELLAQFLDAEEVASQEAFRILVGRYGPMVLGICRQILNREHDAEDAFQATFLVLARNGASIRDRCALAGWLHEVAYRTALKTRARRNRRRTVERQVRVAKPPRDERDDQGDRASLAELRPLLHEEVTGLPDKYRIPVILSYMEGKTNEEVAAILNWPVGTVKGRLSRGRALLRSRLTRRGIALSAATLLLALAGSPASAAVVPKALVRRTLRRALESGISGMAGGSSAPDMPPEASSPEESASPGGGLPGRRSRPGGQMIAGAIVLLTFAAAVAVGFVSSAAYGGKLSGLGWAFSGLMPARNQPVVTSCHPVPIR